MLRHACTHTLKTARTYAHAHARMHANIHSRSHTHTHTYTRTHTHTHTHKRTHTHTHIHSHTHTRTHTHARTHLDDDELISVPTIEAKCSWLNTSQYCLFKDYQTQCTLDLFVTKYRHNRLHLFVTKYRHNRLHLFVTKYRHNRTLHYMTVHACKVHEPVPPCDTRGREKWELCTALFLGY